MSIERDAELTAHSTAVSPTLRVQGDDLLALRAAAAQALRALNAVMNVKTRGDVAGALVHARETLRHALNASAHADSRAAASPPSLPESSTESTEEVGK